MGKKGIFILLVGLLLVFSLYLFISGNLSIGHESQNGLTGTKDSSAGGNGGGLADIFSISVQNSSGGSAAAGTGVSNGLDSGAPYGGRGAFLSNSTSGDRTYCSSLRSLGTCNSEYSSVCGWLDSAQIKCTDGPCVQRYSGECEACMDSRVIYWTEGECPYH